MTIDPTIRADFDPQFLDFEENIMPKLMKAEAELFEGDPNCPKDFINALRYRQEKSAELGIPDKYGVNVPISPEDLEKFDIIDEKIVSFDGALIPVKIYKPKGHEGKKLPVHFNFHGGGFVLGGLYSDVNLVSLLCLKTNFIIIDVDYRMCPEYAFPHPLFDGYSAVKYVYENFKRFDINPTKLSCGGGSAGGQISLGIAHLCRDNKIPLKLVLANVPPADNYVGIKNAEDTRFNGSVLRYENGVMPKWKNTVEFEKVRSDAEKNGKTIDYDSIIYKELDVRAHKEIEAYYTDLFTVKNFKGLARHVISTGGCDHLKDGGKEYAKLLADHEIDVRYYCATGCSHGFLMMLNVLDKSKYLLNLMVNELKNELSD